MKRAWKVTLIILTYTVGMVVGLTSSVSPIVGNTSLNSKKIDRHIQQLQQYSWFSALYEDERYRRSFFANKKVRGYLQSSLRVNRLIKDDKAQKSFAHLLEKQAQLRDNN
ncbi:MAG TPA: hypothetical protein VK945_08000 [Planococcus sp. (in: firmicutes)]|nr:hypothetical protein [Planococcus sp. (in: firmicutes)]